MAADSSPSRSKTSRMAAASASIDAHEVKRVARQIGPTAAAKQLGIARSSVYRMLG